MIARRLGWVPDLPDRRDRIYAVNAPAPQALPSSVDLRATCPPLYDQGDLGSCTANAIAAALEYDRKRQGLEDWTPSRLAIYYNERVLEGTVASDSGAQIRDGIKSVNSQGAGHEALWPYDISQFAVAPSAAAYSDGQLHPAVAYTRVTNTSLFHMRHCLATVGPIVIGFTVYQSFMSDAVAATGIVPLPTPNEPVVGGHAILVVGYDDASERFLCRNSWGIGFGMAGYFTIPYQYLCDAGLADDAWSVQIVK